MAAIVANTNGWLAIPALAGLLVLPSDRPHDSMKQYRKVPRGRRWTGDIECRYYVGYEKLQFSTNISLYLGNDTRHGNSHSGMPI